MTTINDLIEFHDIKQLKYRYLRALDTHDWNLMASCFAEDARVWYSGGKYSRSGRAEIVKFLSDLIPDSFVASHIVVHPELELTSPTTAKGAWRLQDIVHFLEANPVYEHANIIGGEEMTGAGYYYEEYVKLADGWKIASMGYERIFEAIEPRAGRTGFRLEVDPGRGMHVE